MTRMHDGAKAGGEPQPPEVDREAEWEQLRSTYLMAGDRRGRRLPRRSYG